MKRFKEWLAKRRHAKSLRIIRENFKFFGHDLSHLTDEELEAGILRAHKAMKYSGVTLQQAHKGICEFLNASEL